MPIKGHYCMPVDRIHHYRLQEKSREVFKHAILIEEAHHILLRKKQETSGTEAITDIILREIRELGESIILIDQHPSLISMPALGNTYTTICFGLKHKSDMFTISESLLLEREQVDFLGQLETGKAIIKLQGRHFKPFLIHFPLFQVKKGNVSDSDVKRLMRSYSDERRTIRSDMGNRGTTRDVPGDVKKEEPEITLTDIEQQFLENIARNPISGVVARYERLGINRYQGNKTQNSLIDAGLISWRPISTRQGRLKVLVLTEQGKKAIPDIKIEKIFHKQASWEHEYWKYRIGEYYRKKGYMVTFEYPLGGGKSVDLVAEKDGKKIAIEVETGKSDVGYNIKKALEAGFDEIICLPLNSKLKIKLLEELGKNKKVQIMTTHEFISSQIPEVS